METKKQRQSTGPVPVESPLTQYLFDKACQRRSPLSGTFELTPQCNFRCRMCYVRQSAEEVAASPRPPVTLERWLELAEQAKAAGMLYLLLTGGEPLLWPDFWPLYERLADMGLLLSVNTNGSLIDAEAVARFRARPPVRINITLYGASAATYEALSSAGAQYARVTGAIEALQAAGLTVKLNGSLTPWNVQDLPAMVRYAQARGLIYEPVSYMFPPVRRAEVTFGENEGRFTPEAAAHARLESVRLQSGGAAYRRYLQGILAGTEPPPGLDEYCRDPRDGKLRCRAGKSTFWVTWDEHLLTCGMLPEPAAELRGRTFAEAWTHLTAASDEIRLSGICEKCADRTLCHACAAMAQAETGSTGGIPRYLCRMVEALRGEAQQILNAPQETNLRRDNTLEEVDET